MRSPASERLKGQKGFGTVHTPLGGRWGHTPRTLSAALGRRRPNPEAKNKGDALALAAGGRPGAVASPAPRGPRRRAPHPCRPAPSAPRNGGRATKWQPRQAKSERRRRNKRRRGPLPPRSTPMPSRASPGWPSGRPFLGTGAPSRPTLSPRPSLAAPAASRVCKRGGAFVLPNVPHCRRLSLKGTKTERTERRTADGGPLLAQDASRAGAGREQPFPRVSTPAALALGHQSEDRKGESKDIPPNGEIKEMG